MATYKPAFRNTEPTQFVLDEYTCGFAQCVDNNWNYAIYAQNPDVSIYQNEYNAGYVQGKVQTGATILATRNNSWRNFLIGATPQNALSIEVKPEYLTVSAKVLVENYNYLYQWVSARSSDDKVQKIVRLMFRQLGIYDGAAGNAPRTGVELADLQLSSMGSAQAALGYGDTPLTFLDVVFVNSQYDLFDCLGDQLGLVMGYGTAHKTSSKDRPDHCTAFTKMMPDGEVFWTHNSWCCFWAQSCAVTYCIGEDFVTQNANCPGQFGSNTDFGSTATASALTRPPMSTFTTRPVWPAYG